MEFQCEAGVIGGKGFIGGNLAAVLTSFGYKVTFIDARNDDYRFTRLPNYDIIFFCAGNSKVYLSENNPEACLRQSVSALLSYLVDLKYNKFVLISSSMVYPPGIRKHEEAVIDPTLLDIYGANKLFAEFYTKKIAKNYFIARPTGFFGDGLKKNILFDVRNGLPIRVHKDSHIDFMNVERFCMALIEVSGVSNNATVNFGSGFPIKVADIVPLDQLGAHAETGRLIDDRGLELKSLERHTRLYNSYNEVKSEIKRFLAV